MADFHFDEIIKVTDVDDKNYDKVSRIQAQGDDEDMYLVLDVNTEIYPMRAGERYRMLISRTLYLDASTSGNSEESQGKQISLVDKFEYIMHGLMYKMSLDEKDGKSNNKAVVYISFGGLQLMLKADPLKMHKFKVDQKLFLLLRKI